MDKNRKNILVVDDEEEICDLLEVYLVSEGFGVVKSEEIFESVWKEKILG